MKKTGVSLFILILTLINPAKAQNDITVQDDKTGKEEIIEMPEGMTIEFDSLLTDWKAQTYLERDTDCNMQDVNPYFEKKVYIERLSRIPSVMEMPYNSIIQKFIDQYSGKLRRSVSYMLGAANFYIPIFEEALDLYQLPLELKYLPVIESALDPCAVSRAGATGLWQFMLPTAKRYDLKINSLVDERRDPIKSTFAAAQYLRDLYKIYGDWNLVIAAYNCGPTVINKAIHRAGGVNDYWAIYPYLPKETRGYVPAFIAANYIMNYYCEHNICPMKTRTLALTDTVMISRDLNFGQIAAVCNLDINAIRALNPQYKTDIIPGSAEACILRLPQESVMSFIDAGDSVYNYRVNDFFTKRSSVEVDEQELNKTTQSSKSSRSHSSSRSRRSSRTSSKSITVRSGQTLSEIAQKYGTSVSKLRRLNGIKGSNIQAGKKIRVK